MPRRGLPGRRGRDSRSTGLSSGPEGPSSPGGVPAAAGIPSISKGASCLPAERLAPTRKGMVRHI